ncbi:hypothetical protein AKJ16_DCAP22804 [Drosera capensis]
MGGAIFVKKLCLIILIVSSALLVPTSLAGRYSRFAITSSSLGASEMYELPWSHWNPFAFIHEIVATNKDSLNRHHKLSTDRFIAEVSVIQTFVSHKDLKPGISYEEEQQEKRARARVQKRLLRMNTNDYEVYDPAPALSNPRFKLIPN